MAKPAQSTLGSLTGVRALAALAVFVYHLVWMAPGLRAGGNAFAAELLERIALKGYVGVGLFFVLSGFVLAWSQSARMDRARFWERRASRIYPNHIVTWVFAAVMIAFGVLPSPPVTAAVANLFLLPHIFVPGAEWTVMNDPSWSIEVEAVFYLLFPLIFARMARANASSVQRTGLIAAAVTIGAPTLIVVAGLGQDEGLWRLLYFFPVARLPEFIVGMALGVLAKRGQWRTIDHRLAWALVVGAFVVCTFAPVPLSFAAIMLVPVAALISTYAKRDHDGLPSRIGGRTWVHLGLISYAFYAVHGLIVRLVAWHTGEVALSIAQAGALTLLCLGASWAAAEALHHLVEKPAMAIVRRRLAPAAPDRAT